jgi:hypothetical protein
MVSFTNEYGGISFLTEQTMCLRELATKFPGNKGKSLHYETLRRWWKHGVRGVHLETKPFGGKRVSSLEAVDRFINRLAALEMPADEEPILTAPRLDAESQRAMERLKSKRNF